MSLAGAEELFAAFVARFCESGDASVPPDWPEDLRRRCLFFARLVAGPPGGTPSSISRSSSAASAVALPPVPARNDPHRDGERYVVERELGSGGMGRVFLVYDRDFRRRVAMKTLVEPAGGDRRTARFRAEAQATAQLEHPNIAPVYDLGVGEDGTPFFTMKWVRGRNLDEILRAGDPRFSLVRLVQIVQQAAMGVHFANSRGVVHRDLKPQNIMLGDFGEVLVLDWGLAKVLHGPASAGIGSEPLSTQRCDDGTATAAGSVQGSPAYMSPEQARGDVADIDARTDVFGLGAVLYQVLTGTPPYADLSVRVVLGKGKRGEVEPPSARASGRSIPRQLEDICLKAIAARRDDRFQSVGELHDALQRYIEGIHDAERRALEARRLLDAAVAARARLVSAENEASRLEQGTAAARARLADHDPEDVKQPMWDLAARLGSAREEVSRAFNSATAAYLAVLSIDLDQPEARAALADIYYGRLVAAEERGDREAAGLYEGLVRQHHVSRYRVELEGEGRLELVSEPAGAEVLVQAYEERGPLLVLGPPRCLGRTPLSLFLSRGSYLAVLRLPGHCDVRYPFLVRRCGRVEVSLRLHAEGSIAAGFVQIAGGESIVGGDAETFRTLPRARAFVDELFVARFPVTFGEYCRYLDDEFGGAKPGLREHLPFFGEEEYVVVGPDGCFLPIARLGPEVPVMAIPIPAAEAYCRWLGNRLRRSVRLLEEIEWERCARAADGRLYPWGNGFDWAFAKGAGSRAQKPFPEPVGAFPRDESPFGVRDLAGGVRELCAGSYSEGYRPLRGGSWWNPYPFIFRADCRTPRGESTRTTDAGFRVCYDLRS